jgi:putative hydrolase of the HAD superfamily
MTTALTTIGFDADDTLWHNECHFKETEAWFAGLLSFYGDPESVLERLLATERRNVVRYGFGIKGFTLSMIETAIEVTDGKVSGTAIGEILEAGRRMLAHPVEPLPHASAALEALKGRYTLVLITKGDLFDQERKLAKSGLDAFFDAVEIVSAKDEDTYRRLFAKHGTGPDEAAMVGNSLKSDIIPALDAGAWGIHVPHEMLFALEHADVPTGSPRFRSIPDLGALEALIATLG